MEEAKSTVVHQQSTRLHNSKKRRIDKIIRYTVDFVFSLPSSGLIAAPDGIDAFWYASVEESVTYCTFTSSSIT